MTDSGLTPLRLGPATAGRCNIDALSGARRPDLDISSNNEAGGNPAGQGPAVPPEAVGETLEGLAAFEHRPALLVHSGGKRHQQTRRPPQPAQWERLAPRPASNPVDNTQHRPRHIMPLTLDE